MLAMQLEWVKIVLLPQSSYASYAAGMGKDSPSPPIKLCSWILTEWLVDLLINIIINITIINIFFKQKGEQNVEQ